MLFKYAVDVALDAEGRQWLYGGDTRRDDLALKSTNHELLGLAHLLDAYDHHRRVQVDRGESEPSLRHSLAAVLDCQGTRLTAISLLPITEHTLVYGSADGGAHVSARGDVHALMTHLGAHLNLAPHLVFGHELALCGDLEVHAVGANDVYVLDTARVFPPCAPSLAKGSEGKGKGNSIFYKMLRPELVKTNPQALSSDAYSQWQRQDPRHVTLNRHVTYLSYVCVSLSDA